MWILHFSPLGCKSFTSIYCSPVRFRRSNTKGITINIGEKGKDWDCEALLRAFYMLKTAPKCPIYRLPKGGKSYQSWESGAVEGGR